jgi:hypothetical protein
MKDGYLRSELKEIIFYLFILGLTIAIPLGVGLALRGFEESFIPGSSLEFGAYLTSFLTYIPFLFVSLLCIIFPIASLITIDKNKTAVTQTNPSWFRIFTVSFIYAPEKYGMLYKIGEYFNPKKNFMRWSLNPLRILIVSIIIFGIYGLFLIGNPQLSVSGVPQLQQVTLASEVAFGALVPAFAENGLLLFIFMTLMGVNAYICAKRNLGYKYFFAIGILVCILMGFFWGSLHTIVYGNSDASFWATVVFGFFGSLLTMFFGNFIPWYVWHIINNVFRTLSKAIFLKEDLFIITIITIFLVTVIWIGIELLNRKRKKKKQQYSIEGN